MTPVGAPRPTDTRAWPVALAASKGTRTCEQRCLDMGHCCGAPVCADAKPSCAMGCVFARNTESLDACEQTCYDLQGACEYDGPAAGGQHFQMCEGCEPMSGCTVKSPGVDGVGECLQACLFVFGCKVKGRSYFGVS